ncbi:MAG: hypothetical protein E6G62_11480 [Actinobacteria bacterium]|nr:MAG: hypothetical protein E6G62_11480 [Actinomycetota bacterium]
MTLPRRQLGAVAVLASAISLAVPGVAGATGPKAGDRTFQQTYPLASKVCASVAAGTEGKHLKRFAAQVLADCTALQSGFTAAQSTVLAARVAQQIAADRAATMAACPKPNDQPPVCLQTRRQNNAALVTLKHQLVRAAHRYYRTIEASRDRFWKAIRALPGEGHVHEDEPVPVLSS